MIFSYLYPILKKGFSEILINFLYFKIVEDLDNVTDIFADLPSPSVEDKQLSNLKLTNSNKEEEDIFADNASVDTIVTTSKDVDDNLSDTSDDSGSSPLTDSYLLSDAPQASNKKLLEELDQVGTKL